MAQPRNHCIFCGPTNDAITREDIWPLWLGEHLKTKRLKLEIARRRRKYAATAWPTNKIELAAKVVCKKCNNEDLSDLENKHAKPALLPLIDGEPTALSLERQAAIAAWLTKIAMVYEFTGGPMRQFFSQQDREHFIRSMSPPPTTWVWLASVGPGYGTALSQHALYPRNTPQRQLLRIPPPQVQILSGVMGHLAFQLLTRRGFEFLRTVRMRRITDPWLTKTLLIYPSKRVVVWPPSHALEDNALKPFSDRWGSGTASGYWF